MTEMQPRPYTIPLATKKWRGLYFDGISGFVSCGNNSSLYTDSSFTLLTLLTSFENAPTASKIIAGKYNVNASGFVTLINITDGRLYDVIYRTGAGSTHYDNTIVKNKIATLGFIYDKPAVTSKIYHNDSFVEQGTMGTMVNNTGTNFVIGSNSVGNANFFNGIIYKIIYIKETLTQAQIRNILLGKDNPMKYSCKLWHDYRLGHAKDLSGNGNNGVLYGGARWV